MVMELSLKVAQKEARFTGPTNAAHTYKHHFGMLSGQPLNKETNKKHSAEHYTVFFMAT